MKQIFLASLLVILAATTGHAQKLLSQSSEPKPSFDQATGQAIIMPIILTNEAARLAAAEPALKKLARVRNRAQIRLAKTDSTRNGYYPGMGSRDWGTSMRLNHYLFLRPSVTSGL